MRLVVVWSVVVAGCSFEHGFPVAGGGSGCDVVVDAPVAIDAAIDTPVVQCSDDDADGICNDVDDWPCGVKPAAPNATVMFTGNSGQTKTTITNVNLDTTGRLAVAMPGEHLGLTLHYDVDDTACPNACIDQVEIGWEPDYGRYMCVFDDPVPKSSGVAATVNVTISAPTAKKVYDLRVNLGQNYSCGTSSTWWSGTPDAMRTIAKLCVH